MVLEPYPVDLHLETLTIPTHPPTRGGHLIPPHLPTTPHTHLNTDMSACLSTRSSPPAPQQ